MENTQFRDYVFRHNPAVITIRSGAHTAERLCPGRGGVVADLGPRPRTVVCKGSFWGEAAGEAMAQAAAFRRATADSRSGVLFLPGMEPFPARLVEFVLEASGDGRVLPYAITFREGEAGE